MSRTSTSARYRASRPVDVLAETLAEHAHHQQHRVGAVRPRDEELHGVDDEVLAQHGHVDRVGDVGEVVERAAERSRARSAR